MDLEYRQQGNLAEAVSRSANNLYLFTSSTIHDPIDPGADRLAAVPIEDAVHLFHPTKVIAVNVTNTPAFYRRTAGVAVQEIMISVAPSDKAFMGAGPEFDKIYWAGYQTTKKALQENWWQKN